MRTALQIAHHISEYKQTYKMAFETGELVKLANAYIRAARRNVDMREKIRLAIAKFNTDGMGWNEAMDILLEAIKQ